MILTTSRICLRYLTYIVSFTYQDIKENVHIPQRLNPRRRSLNHHPRFFSMRPLINSFTFNLTPKTRVNIRHLDRFTHHSFTFPLFPIPVNNSSSPTNIDIFPLSFFLSLSFLHPRLLTLPLFTNSYLRFNPDLGLITYYTYMLHFFKGLNVQIYRKDDDDSTTPCSFSNPQSRKNLSLLEPFFLGVGLSPA